MAEVTLYHGSVSVIEQPVFGKGKPHNDYGRGFYCTQSIELAKEWAVEEDRDGYANRYLLDLQGLNVLDLSQRGLPRCIGSLCFYKTVYEAKKKV